jgi:hypothetical protein
MFIIFDAIISLCGINDDNDDDDGEDLQEDLQEEGDDISYGKGSPTSSSPVLISDDILSSRPS